MSTPTQDNKTEKDKLPQPDKKKEKEKEKKEDELSEEDVKKKQELDLLVERSQDKDVGVQKFALETLHQEIKSSTSSMTSVPKPLKFLRPHYDTLKTFFESMEEGTNKKLLADILSILSMTMSKPGVRDSLAYKFKGNTSDLSSWGHEYVRHLSAEIAEEFPQRQQEEKSVTDLTELIDYIVPFNMRHNAEPDACDLLIEVEQVSKLLEHVDEKNYSRVCLYLINCASLLSEPDDGEIFKVVMNIYLKLKKLPDALRIAIRLNDTDLIQEIYSNCEDLSTKKQLAFILGRQNIFSIEETDETLLNIIDNAHLNEHYLALARDLEVIEPKHPEDIYKSHLTERSTSTQVDSARQNLASTFVNAFVNAGFGNDKLMTEEGNKWLDRNKEHGMMSAAASLGLVLLWDVDGGMVQVDKYMYRNEDYVKAGVLLAIGILNSGVRNECDPTSALLSGHLDSNNANIKKGAIMGLGLAYAGTAREDIYEMLAPIVVDSKTSIEVVALAGLAIGQIFVGTCHPDATTSLLQALLERDEQSLNSTHTRFLSLGLGLLYLGKQEAADLTLETLKALRGPAAQYASTTVETCAYIATGNVLKIQKLLHICGDHLEKDNSFQAVAVLGIALISMGEDIGAEMSLRTFDHLLQYGEPVIRRAVPLALGLVSISNPRISVMDTLSKLSHDSDAEVAMCAIFSLGLIGAGTNNSRIGGLLRQLSSYYYKDPNSLLMVRLAQGLLHLGKGTLSLSPFHSHHLLLSRVAVSGILVVLHAFLDVKGTILSKSHFLLFALVSAMHPRMLMTLDEELKPVPVSVRVGQAVDIVGQAGKPKTITGFQTHTTPVLLGAGERAELATDEYTPLSSVLEGFVILKKKTP
eukprot:TRINITY_DN766_c0_g4_i1.p1 TRINITY_DN766_c0_g4~~TRINITY_DN766_c0_g4_i1.p1  ORF type:complete len:865 (-),score=217.23 TRINITY_DN766_c0_g4_i1:30-2624(-)